MSQTFLVAWEFVSLRGGNIHVCETCPQNDILVPFRGFFQNYCDHPHKFYTRFPCPTHWSISFHCWPLNKVKITNNILCKRKLCEPCTYHATDFLVELYSIGNWSVRGVVNGTLLKEPVLKTLVMVPRHNLRDHDIMEFGTNPENSTATWGKKPFMKISWRARLYVDSTKLIAKIIIIIVCM